MAEKTVGYVGLGIMGLPMAKNLVDAGYTVVGRNRSTGPMDELAAYGGERADSLGEVAGRCDVIFTCLPDSETVEHVVLGTDGVLAGAGRGTTVIDMSTIAPPVAQSVAGALDDHGLSMLDAPVSGGETGAKEGSLSIMVGGDRDVFDSQRDVLSVVGETITYCGESGAGQIAKATHQTIVAGTLEVIAEALVMAGKAGSDMEAIYDAISNGGARGRLLDVHGTNMLTGDFEPGFFAEYMYEDLGYALEAGEAYGAPMPAASTTHEMFKALVENGHGRDANSAIVTLIEDLAGGVDVRLEDGQEAQGSGIDW
jgi:3-hydroxyisobutyrate dehydrogenase-like beta-hydroxyacid dehydrogenase